MVDCVAAGDRAAQTASGPVAVGAGRADEVEPFERQRLLVDRWRLTDMGDVRSRRRIGDCALAVGGRFDALASGGSTLSRGLVNTCAMSPWAAWPSAPVSGPGPAS